MPCPARFSRATWDAPTAVCWCALQLAVVAVACVLGTGRAVAAASIPTVPLSSDAAIDVSPGLELYEDAQGTLSLSDAQALAQAGRFGPHPLQQPRHRQRSGVFWGRLRLQPRATDGEPKTVPVLLLFSFPYARWNEVTLYRRDERGHVTALRSGHAVPLSERAFAEPQTGFPLTLSAGHDEELFLRMVKHPHLGGFMSLRNVEITLQSNTGYLQRARDIWLYQGLYLGIIIIMILYNIVIYTTERDVSLLWYSGMLASLGVYFLENSGVGFYLPGVARAFALWDWYGGGGVILVAVVVCFCQFSRHYLSLTRYSRPFDRLLWTTAPLTGMGFLICYVTGHLQLGHFVTYCGALASLIGGVGGALHAIFKGYRPAFVYLLSTFIMSIFGSTNMVRMLFAKILYLPLLYSNLFQVGTALQIALLSLGLAYRLRLLRTEREKTERLLRNVLPAAIAERLKAGEHAIAERFDEVSVLFADIVGFTHLASRIGPEQIVARLNTVFSRFDELTDQYGLEKIKTIGDCYMVVSGVPLRREDHLQALLSMALDLLAWMRSEGAQGSDPESEPLRIRIGIHSGPVVAGVIGRQKFAFDLWGDTVNTASRMESHGEPDRIQCTPAVYEHMKDRFEFAERGEIDIKGKGRMRTYFLLARRP
ncbi:MAG: hypothetical protein JNJ46_29160 [Myxococcales bacterium]|nr:hypothetical protein [Myxococcales bacterium]